jgi:hypothetical protein
MKNYNYVCSQPAVPSRHRDQAEATDGKLTCLREALAGEAPAVWYCSGGAYGYFVSVCDDNWEDHAPYFQTLLLLEDPKKEMSLDEALEYCALEKSVIAPAVAAAKGNTVDSLKVGWLDAAALTEEA